MIAFLARKQVDHKTLRLRIPLAFQAGEEAGVPCVAEEGATVASSTEAA